MDDVPSHWPLWRKLLAIALLIGVLLIVRWAVSNFMHQLPDFWLDLLVVGTIALGLALWGYDRLTRSRRIDYHRDGNSLPTDPE
jgi:hypothetical protein